MITKLSHVTLFVNNQEEAKKFYVNTLGFEVRTDHTMDGGFSWLTVGPDDPEGRGDCPDGAESPARCSMKRRPRPCACCSRKACSAQASSRSTTAARLTKS